jgi:hypothetical protein
VQVLLHATGRFLDAGHLDIALDANPVEIRRVVMPTEHGQTQHRQRVAVREWLRTIFEGVPDDLRRRIVLENPCLFFGLDSDRAITPTPA